MTPPPTPRPALSNAWSPGHLADAVLGDLEELFAAEAARSPWRARLRLLAPGRRRRLASARHRRRPPVRVRGDSPMHTVWKDVVHGLRLFVTQPGYAWAAVGHAGAGHRRQHRDLHHRQRAGDQAAAVRSAGAARLDPGQRPECRAGPRRRRRCPTTPPIATRSPPSRSSPPGGGCRPRCAPTITPSGCSARRCVGDLQGVWGLRGDARPAADAAPTRARAPPGCVTLSHRFWTTRYGGADAVVGRDVLRQRPPAHHRRRRCPRHRARQPVGDRSVGADRRRPGAGQPQPSAAGARSAGSPTAPALADAQRAGGGDRAAAGPRAPRHQPRLDGPRRDRPARPSPAPTPGSCCRCSSPWSGCCWCWPAPTS